MYAEHLLSLLCTLQSIQKKEHNIGLTKYKKILCYITLCSFVSHWLKVEKIAKQKQMSRVGCILESRRGAYLEFFLVQF